MNYPALPKLNLAQPKEKATIVPKRTALSAYGLPIVLFMALIILLRGINDISYGYPDADRFLLDGVFILDFLRDLPITRVYDFTIRYYAQYPGLSIGYHPPFFPLIEALFNGTFGINIWSSRLAVTTFMIIGISAWYKLVSATYGNEIGFWSSLLLVTNVSVMQWGWYTMSELPVLAMVLAAAYFFYSYTKTDAPKNLYLASLFFILAAWTKQPAIFISAWFFLYIIVEKKLGIYFRRKEMWICIVAIVVAIVPLAIITIWLGDMNLAQSIGTGADGNIPSRLSSSNLLFYLKGLVNDQLSPPVFLFSIIGLLLSLRSRDQRSWYFLLAIITTYAFFTYVLAKETRYTIFWVPMFCLFAALPLIYLQNKQKLKVLFALILGAIVLFQINTVYSKKPMFASGYAEAAQYVINKSKSPTVFVDAYNNGYFTYHVRRLDPSKSMYVLRGDKLLSSSAISATSRLKIHADSYNDINSLFNKYGVTHIVVESLDRTNVKIHTTLREHLKSNDFELVASIPVQSNRTVLTDQQLLIYEYQHPKIPTAGFLELDLPLVGKTIKVPLREKLNMAKEK